MFLDCFRMLILKIILKNKKYYFKEFLNKNHFKPVLLLQSHTSSYTIQARDNIV
jgi:hypothetical protein